MKSLPTITLVSAGAVAVFASATLSSPASALEPSQPATAPTTSARAYPLPGDTGAGVSQLQTWLNNVGIPVPISGTYDAATSAAVEHFQWKFFLPETGNLSNATVKKLSKLGAKGDRVPSSCKTAKQAVCGDETQKVLRYFSRGKLMFIADARYTTQTGLVPTGNYRVQSKTWTLVSSAYHTWMPRALFFDGDAAIHYSPFFKELGYASASHGCVGLNNLASATKLYKLVKIGTTVKIYR